MVKNGKKVKGTPYHFGQFCPVFQLFKDGWETKQTAFEPFWTTPSEILGLFKPFYRSWKNDQNRPKSKG